MRPLARALLYGIELRFWVASCVMSLAAFAQTALSLRPHGPSTAVVFLATLALYNLDASLDAPRARVGSLQRRVHVGLSAASALPCLVLGASMSTSAFLLLLAGLALCGAYAVPLGQRQSSLKKVSGLKTPFVGLSVACASVGIPALDSPTDPPPNVMLWLILVLALCCSTNALLFDIPDIDEDNRDRIPTLPAVLGLSASRMLGFALASGAALLTWLTPAAVPVGAQVGLGALCGALVLGTIAIGPRTRRAMVALAIDGALILPWAVSTFAP